jgi:hypothetical protein
MGGADQPGSGGSSASAGGQPGTSVTNSSQSSGCTFAPGPGARPAPASASPMTFTMSPSSVYTIDCVRAFHGP